MFPFLPAFVPDILQITPVVLAFCYGLAPVIRKHPVPFYILFAIATFSVTWFKLVNSIMGPDTPSFVLAVSAWFEALPVASLWLNTCFQVLTSSHTGVAFYLIVMFIGAMEPTARVKRLLSIRTEMSIIGGIIIFAHCVRVHALIFLGVDPSFQAQWGELGGLFMMLAYSIVGSLLTIVFMVLWVTSFRAVRRKFKPGAWKRLQRLAYPFMALTVIQGMLIATSHILLFYPFDGQRFYMAMMSSPTGWLSNFAGDCATVATYLMIGIFYLVMRLNKRRADIMRKERRAVRREKTSAAD